MHSPVQDDTGAERGCVLTLQCPDRPGIVHAVSGFLIERDGNIVESQQFGDPDHRRFFLRVHFTVPASVSVAALSTDFADVARHFEMQYGVWDAQRRLRTLILVSKFDHCLNDLLFRMRSDSLQIEVPVVVSNHPDVEQLVGGYGVDFEHVPVTAETKGSAEQRLLELIEERDIDLVVLARYMQILSNDTCRRLAGRAINIHHSFLPSFKGARPYHQAFDRGVKLIGATAHYVTADLDEGPIIEQDVVRVDHRLPATGLVAAGRDVEAQVLSRAVGWHAAHRVLMNGDRTVVFG